MTHTEFVQGLRNAADFFEARPELGIPSLEPLSFRFYGNINGKSVDTKEGLAEFVRIVGGKIEKSGDEDFFRLTACRDGFTVTAVAYRSGVCENVVVGEKLVEGRPAEYREATVDHMEPVYEWKCPTLLSDESPADSPSQSEGE